MHKTLHFLLENSKKKLYKKFSVWGPQIPAPRGRPPTLRSPRTLIKHDIRWSCNKWRTWL